MTKSTSQDQRLHHPEPRGREAASGGSAAHTKDQDLRPWQFFVLAGLGCATAATFLARGQGVTSVLLLGILMAATTLVGIAALGTVLPLVSPADDRTVMIGQRTRVALEREKTLVLRSIKELEFDRAMGKVSEADWHEMSTRLRARASRLIRQLDAGTGYRERIEHDLAARLGSAGTGLSSASTEGHDRSAGPDSMDATAKHACAICSTVNDADARFCKGCGAQQ